MSFHRRLYRVAGREWPVAALVVVAALAVLPGLGAGYLWEDEGDTAVLARSIVSRGLPVAWDGTTLTVPDFGQRLDPDFVMVSHPWLQYYLAAASFRLLGESAFAARLPFALAGIACVVVLYRILLAAWGSRRAAFTAAALLLLNVQFLLYARQARNYTVHALLTCLVIWTFTRLTSARAAVWFALLGIVLFHAHPLGLVTVATLGLLTVLYPPFRDRRRWFWPSAATIGAYATPWLAASGAGYAQNSTVVPDAFRVCLRLPQALVELASVLPLVGVAVLFAVVAARHARELRQGPPSRGARAPAHPPAFSPEERVWLVISGALGIAYVLVMAVTLTRDDMWISGVRQVVPLVPLVMATSALLIEKVGRRSWRVWVTLVIVFGFTSLGRLTPWVLWAEAEPLRPPEALVGFHVPINWPDGVLRTAQYQYVRSLLARTRGTVAGISEFLETHAAPGDRVITNYDWEAVYFHTRLPQALKVRPSFPIYKTVRERLPDYVYSARGVRWIVWRQAWAPLWGQDCERLIRELRAAKIPVRLVASLPETLYENRENVHFRRYAGGVYLYPWFDDLPPTLIYRVDWPDAARAGKKVP